jgi:hypothetical protein
MMQNYMDEEEEVDIMGGIQYMDSDEHDDDWASDK